MGGRRRQRATATIVACACVILILALPARTFGQGGPPLITDDPDTPGPGYWEINLATVVERSSSERRIEQPLADINYGVGRRIQLKFEIPWLSVHDHDGLSATGPGNAVYGVKWRFLGQEGKRLAWSIYPQVAVNSSKAMSEKDFVGDGPELFFPTELTVEVSHVEINGEIGRTFRRHDTRTWAYGISTEIETHLGFELVAELHGEQIEHAPTEVIANIGARPRITRQIVLLVAAGTAVHGLDQERTRLRLFTGVQFNLPGRYVFNRLPTRWR